MTLSILFVNFLTLILLSFFGWCVVLQNIWHIAGVRAHMQRNRYIVGAYMYDGTLALTRNWRKHIRLLIEKVICSLPSVSAWQFHSYLLDFSHRRWCSGPARTGIRPSRLGDDSPGDAIWDLHRARLTLLTCPGSGLEIHSGGERSPYSEVCFCPLSEHSSLRPFYALNLLDWKQTSRQAERKAEIKQKIRLSRLDPRIKESATAKLS